MKRLLALLSAAVLTLPAQARAETPNVVTDIAPVHSIVAYVMQGAGTPTLLIDAANSPHDFALRPSQARHLQDADLVVWMGAALTPPLERAIDALNTGTQSVSLLDLPGTTVLEPRDPDHAAEDHSGDSHHGAGTEDEIEDHGHEDGHEDEHEDGHDHGHDHDAAVDPHAWLDPENAATWALHLAEILSARDPENATLYRTNAARFAAEARDFVQRTDDDFAARADKPHLSFHDGFQYFEMRFGLSWAGAISASDASPPSPAQLARLRQRVMVGDIVCLFSEPQLDPRLARVVAEGTGLQLAIIDPLGQSLEPGAGHYFQLLQNVSDAFANCS